MKSFLVKAKKPIVKWKLLHDNIFFEGKVPEGYNLAVSPSKNYIVIDIDRHGDTDGFENVPRHLINELGGTLTYPTKNDGRHCWFKYTGDKPLANRTSGQGIDLRTDKGYVVWYPKVEFRSQIETIKESSIELNNWLEELFSFKSGIHDYVIQER